MRLLGSSIMFVGVMLQCSAFSLAHMIDSVKGLELQRCWILNKITGESSRLENGKNTSTVPK
jgi:hypothetical protein